MIILCVCGHNNISHYDETGWCGGYSWTGVPCPCEKYAAETK